MLLAIKHAILKRDVSHLTFPDEVQIKKARLNAKSKDAEGRISELGFAPPKQSFDQALKLINEAQRPVIIVGHGSRFHMDKITEFAEKMNCPVFDHF